MHRTRGKVFGTLVALAAAGLLAACGSNSSSASSTPSLKPSVTTSAAASSTPASVEPGDSGTPAPEPTTTQSVERPAPAPAGTPAAAPLTPKQQGFLDALKKNGVNPSQTDIAISAAEYICQAKAANAPADQMQTFVNAIAGQDPNYDPQKMPIDQAGNAYISAATSAYCNK
ncbi:DUF732 domain-containing protein [Nocardia stercoris]|uniref:DUF732 domain-containing protein n=1 Tax=Nocardia stercoris TaxID=2483361 RepID=A0A3M2L9F8_9NOCA|nr:DUF732 domain-containing protein [Nocardia stercoris]RMI34209.1 DUF732 domain-containing protein [Nocardia stercoris]